MTFSISNKLKKDPNPQMLTVKGLYKNLRTLLDQNEE